MRTIFQMLFIPPPRIFSVIAICIMLSCSKDRVFENPYDTGFNPSLWKANGMSVNILPSQVQVVSWGPPSKPIEGFVVSRTIDGVTTSVTVSSTTRTWNFDPISSGKCSVVRFSLQAKAGNNLSDPLISSDFKLPITSIVNAGPGLVSGGLHQRDFVLSASAPANGETGEWSVREGTGGSFSQSSSPTATFTGVPCSKYLLRWTITGPCSISFQDITVDFKRLFFEVASVGPDVTAYGTSLSLKGNTPPPGDTGTWTIVSGTGGSLVNPSSPTTVFNGQTGVNYVLQWTISDGCSSVSAILNVKMLPAPIIDGMTYPLVTIGSQTWFAQDLVTTRYANGDPIINITDNTIWSTSTTGAWANYNNNNPNPGSPYGKLYNGYAVIDSRGLCPAGTHVSTLQDWVTLINWLGGIYAASQYLKVPNVWANEPNNSNSSGFSAWPSGFLDETGVFSGLGNTGMWWIGDGLGRIQMIPLDVPRATGTSPNRGMSVRCIYN